MKQLTTTLTVFLLACVLCSCGKDREDDHSLIELIPVEVIKAQAIDSFPITEQFSGIVEARQSADLAFEVPGTVIEILFEEGQRIDRGDVIARIDRDRLEAQRLQLEAQLSQARAALARSTSEFSRDQKLLAADAVTQKQLDQSREALRTAESARDSIVAQISAIGVDLEKSSLRAPFNGTLSDRFIDEGAVVSPNQRAFTLLELENLEVRVAIHSTTLKPGAEVTAKRSDGGELSLTLARILPRRDATSRTTDHIFTFSETPTSVVPGDLVRLQIQEEIQSEGFLLPLSALTESSRGLWACFIAESIEGREDKAARVERRDLEVIHAFTEMVIVRGGLSEDDRVISGGLHKVSPGQLIEILKTREPLELSNE